MLYFKFHKKFNDYNENSIFSLQSTQCTKSTSKLISLYTFKCKFILASFPIESWLRALANGYKTIRKVDAFAFLFIFFPPSFKKWFLFTPPAFCSKFHFKLSVFSDKWNCNKNYRLVLVFRKNMCTLRGVCGHHTGLTFYLINGVTQPGLVLSYVNIAHLDNAVK